MSKKPKSLLYGDHRPRTGPEADSWEEAFAYFWIVCPAIGFFTFLFGGVILGSQVCRWIFPLSLIIWIGYMFRPTRDE